MFGDLEASCSRLEVFVEVPVQSQPGAEVVDGLEMLQFQQTVLDGVTQNAVVPLSQHGHAVGDVEDGWRKKDAWLLLKMPVLTLRYCGVLFHLQKNTEDSARARCDFVCAAVFL